MSTSKPEAGQWWFKCGRSGSDAKRNGVRVTEVMSDTQMLVESVQGYWDVWAVDEFSEGWHHEPRCTGWDWVVPADLTPPAIQPNPDEWVVQDRVPPRAGVDLVCWSHWKSGEEVVAQGTWMHRQVHGYTDCFGHRLSVRCRRRDLPPVEQPEQWPKYYTGIIKGAAYVKRLSPRECVVVETDGTQTGPMRWSDWDERKRTEITEAEAMALLKNPEPQPAKTRVRLWATPEGRPYFAPFQASKHDDEIHVDAEGFYVES